MKSQETYPSYDEQEALVEREAWELFAYALALAVAVAGVAVSLVAFFHE